MMKKKVSCKKVFGITFCQFNSGQRVMVPTDKQHSIPLDIYDSKKISKNSDLTKKVNKINKRLNSLFLVRDYDVEKHPTPDQVIMIPTIMIGDEVITDTNVNEMMLLNKANVYLSRLP
jgi:hypothetical protein